MPTKPLQSCLTVCDPMDCRPPGSSVPGILQARTLERVAISSSNAWMRPYRRQPTRLLCPWDSPGKNTGVGCRFLLQCMKVKSESEVAQSCPTLSDPWTAAHQAPPPMGSSRQEYWSGVSLPSPEGSLMSCQIPPNSIPFLSYSAYTLISLENVNVNLFGS